MHHAPRRRITTTHHAPLRSHSDMRRSNQALHQGATLFENHVMVSWSRLPTVGDTLPECFECHPWPAASASISPWASVDEPPLHVGEAFYLLFSLPGTSLPRPALSRPGMARSPCLGLVASPCTDCPACPAWAEARRRVGRELGAIVFVASVIGNVCCRFATACGGAARCMPVFLYLAARVPFVHVAPQARR